MAKITKAQYEQGSQSFVQVEWDDGAVSCIPKGHRLYEAVDKWTAAGNTIEPAPTPSVVPEIIDAAQGQYILIEMDLWDSVLAYIAAIPSKKQRQQAETAVFRTQRWRRDSATLIQMAQALGITEEQMDEMFIAADKVKF